MKNIGRIERFVEKAIKKAVPERVSFEDIGTDRNYEPVYGAICPSCGKLLVAYSDESTEMHDFGKEETPEQLFKHHYVHHDYMGNYSYCDRCGQKLNWGKYPKRKKGKTL